MDPRKLCHLLSLAAVLLTTPMRVYAQPTADCDSIVIGDIRFSATNAGIIEVPAAVLNNACVGYPFFVLYDQSGDTLATENVFFFCLAFGPLMGIHSLELLPGVSLESGPQLLTLELFSGFGDTLVCSWDLLVDLCPPDSCVSAQLTFTDWHVQTTPAQVYWFLEDSLGATVGSGVFELDGVDRNAQDSVCIVPGADYNLWVSPFTPINVSDSINLAVSSNQGITGLINFFQNDDFPSDMDFGWYAACADSPNSVQEAPPVSFQAWQQGGSLFIRPAPEVQFLEVRLLNMHGQVVRTRPMRGLATLDVQDLIPGVYVVHARARSGAFAVQKLHIE